MAKKQKSQDPDYLILKNNVKELLEGFLLVHNTALRRGIRELFPFSLIFPKPKYASYQKLLKRLSVRMDQQIEFCNTHQNEAEPFKSYYSTMKMYVAGVKQSTLLLADVCKQKEALMEKGQGDRKKYNALLKKYNESNRAYYKISSKLNKAFVAVTQAPVTME